MTTTQTSPRFRDGVHCGLRVPPDVDLPASDVLCEVDMNGRRAIYRAEIEVLRDGTRRRSWSLAHRSRGTVPDRT